MDCEHPKECEAQHIDGELVCGWCEDIRVLTERCDMLRQQLGKQAVIVYNGEVQVVSEQSIGLLEIYGGTITCIDKLRMTVDPTMTDDP